MRINNLNLINYRNHINKAIVFDSELISIIGPNGIGKTNILEAIHIVSTGKSSRAKRDSDLINYDKNFSTINCNVSSREDDLNLEIQIIKENEDHRTIKKAKVNKTPKTLHNFYGLFTSVFFIPEDINLLTEPPSERRKYIDSIIVQVDSSYKKNLNLYTKAVKQRNKILEKINKENKGWDEMGYWTQMVANTGSIIQDKRESMFNEIKYYINENAVKLEITNDSKNNSKVALNYKKNEINEERFEKYKAREIASKTTLIGPHRDDFEIFIDGHSVSDYSSRGQQRGIILSLKLSEIEYIEKEKKERPVLLLDDIFSELDENHKKAIQNIINKQQTIITSTDNISFLHDNKIIRLG